MSRKFQLNADQQTVLARAAQRNSRLLFPIPDVLGDNDAKIARALAPLRRRGLIEQGISGLFITDAGLKLLEGRAGDESKKVEGSLQRGKTIRLIGLLSSDTGATIEDMVALTNWLPHSIRAALASLRKRGYKISSDKVDGVRTYRIGAGGAA